MLGLTTSTSDPTRQAALDSLIAREGAAANQAAVKRWQKAVREIGLAEADRDAEVAELQAERDKTRSELRATEPAFKAASAKFAYTTRRLDSVTRDHSQRITRLHSDAENVAPPQLRQLRAELLNEIDEMNRGCLVEAAEEPTGKSDKHGRPVFHRRTNLRAIEARRKAIQQLIEQVDELRTQPVDDLDKALDDIRAAVPSPRYPIAK